MTLLSSDRPQPAYSCKQNELYSIALIGWKNFTDHQTEFEAFNTLYTVAFGTAMKAAVLSAKALPDEFQRNEVHTTLRINLADKSQEILIKWQQLESFISYGYPEDEYTGKIASAGHGYYNDAANEDWESVQSLLDDADAFIAANAAALTAGGMTVNFPLEFGTLKTDFETLHENFMDAEQDGPELTDEKLNANNTVHKDMMKMLSDAQKITRNNAALRQRFTFSYLLDLVGGGSTSDTAGYNVDDYFIGPGESMLVSEDMPGPDEDIYGRVVIGNNAVVICSTDEAPGDVISACGSGYTLEPQVTFKGKFSELGLDMTKARIKVTNPGTEEVLFRGGKKI